MEYIKILIVDDHLVVREGLKFILETDNRILVTDEASNGKEALKLLEVNRYDVILLDIYMPIMNGLEFLKEKVKIYNEIPVIILTTADDKEMLSKFAEIDSLSIILKDSTRNMLIDTIIETYNGNHIISDEIVRMLSTYKKTDFNLGRNLTEKELVVLEFVVEGETSKAIAIETNVSERTVKAHLTNIYRKLNVNSRTEAVAVALSNGIV